MGEIYIAYEYWFAAFQLVFAMLGMGATLTVVDFSDVMKAPKSVTIGTLMQLVLVPFLAYLFISMAGIVGGVAVGMALIAAIPGGTTSNIFTYMAKGNSPLSISVTAITTLACLLTTPFILKVLIIEYLPAGFAMPTAQIVNDIALTLLLPLAIGMVILAMLPKYAAAISKWCIRASLFGIALIVIGSSIAGRLDIDAFGGGNILLVIAFVLALTVAGWVLPTVFGFTKPDITAVQMEMVVRNVNLGVLIKASMFPVVLGASNTLGDMVLFTVLLYGAIQMLIAALLITWHRRGSRPVVT
ncbi:MAG: bile acid:sodium symporter family protein [Arenicella sp.]|nr:bile acid:sodium symporter family protein [Arenicella sp.]